MENICIYIILIIISIAFSIKTEKKLGISFFITIASISLIQFVLGIINLFKLGIIFSSVIAIIGLVYIFYYFYRNKKLKEYLKNNIFDLLFFTIVYLIIYILFKGMKVIRHNELAHWGLLVKNMLYADSLPTLSSNLVYVGYPPIVGVWEYFFSNFFLDFKDEYFYISNAILQFSLVFGIVSILNKKWIQSFLINIVMVLALFTISYLVFITLFVDITISLVFIFIIAYIYIMEKMTNIDFFILAISLIFLELTKEIGMLFVILALIYLLIMQWKYYKKEIKKLCMKIILIFLIVILFKNIWTLYLDFNNLNQAWDGSGFNLTNVINFISGKGESYQYQVTLDYFKAILFKENYLIFNMGISQIVTLLFSLIIITIIYVITRDNKVLKTLIISLILNFTYIIGLLVIYLFSFAKWEAEVLLAFERYVQIINVINIMLMFFVLFDKARFVGIPSIILIIIINFASDTLLMTVTNLDSYSKKTEIISDSYCGIDKYKDLINDNDKIYIITEYDNEIMRELVLLNLRYKMVPNNLYISDDEDITVEELEEKLRCGYTYVYVFNYSNESIQKYKTFLKESEDNIFNGYMFKIIYEDNNLLLEKVDI